MRFTIDKEQFLKGLLIASHAIGVKAANPTLLCFKLDLTAKGLEIVGSNSEIAIWTLIPNQIGDNVIIRNGALGSALINAHILTEVVRRLEAKELSLEIIDNVVAKIDDDKSSFKLDCSNPEEYPDLNLEKSGNSFSIPCTDLCQLVDQTSFAALTKETRAILMAINLKAENGKLTATATDSARLSRKSINVDPALRFSCNIPAKTLNDVVHLLNPGESVEISATAEKIIFSFNNTIVSSRLISGDYPVSNSIIPTTFNYFLEVNSQQFLSAIDRIAVLSQNQAPVVKLTMDEESVEASSSNSQIGSGVEKLTAIQYTGEHLEIAFNSTFVSDAVKALGSEDVVISFIGEMKPFVIKNPKDDSIVELITPMRTR
jgi:DNA polymerase-3 subunit beta